MMRCTRNDILNHYRAISSIINHSTIYHRGRTKDIIHISGYRFYSHLYHVPTVYTSIDTTSTTRINIMIKRIAIISKKKLDNMIAKSNIVVQQAPIKGYKILGKTMLYRDNNELFSSIYVLSD